MDGREVKGHPGERPAAGRPLDAGERITLVASEGKFTLRGHPEIPRKPGWFVQAYLGNMRVQVRRILAGHINSVTYITVYGFRNFRLLAEDTHS
jgi:hypothetical protein